MNALEQLWIKGCVERDDFFALVSNSPQCSKSPPGSEVGDDVSDSLDKQHWLGWKGNRFVPVTGRHWRNDSQIVLGKAVPNFNPTTGDKAVEFRDTQVESVVFRARRREEQSEVHG